MAGVDVIKQISKIADKYKSIRRVVLFGSRARGDANSHSDYDIAVVGCDTEQKSHFLLDIEEIETLQKIDVVFIEKRHFGSAIYENIKREGVDIMNKFRQKLDNFEKALERLHESIEETKSSDSSTLRDGVIQRFEFTTELAWKTAREYLITQEVADINAPKAVIREAFSNSLIKDEAGWLQILHDRNSTSHIYDEEDTNEVFARIVDRHIVLFDQLLALIKAKSE